MIDGSGSVKTIPVNLYDGSGTVVHTLVDAEDYESLSRFKWRLIGSGYVARPYERRINGRRRYLSAYMHREIMRPDQDVNVDHINRNPLDNRRSNLRLCTQAQNGCNRPGLEIKNGKPVASKYKGVRATTSGKKNPWTATIKAAGKTRYLGCFKTEEEAAQAYNVAAIELQGEFAYLNEIPAA